MTSRKESIIKLENVWKIYDMGHVQVEALRGISVDIQEGEFVAIMGPSGSGKSTCVNMIGCLDLPTKGRILLSGKDISHMAESSLTAACPRQRTPRLGGSHRPHEP